MAGEGLPKADTFPEAKEPNPKAVEVGGFSEDENGPEEG